MTTFSLPSSGIMPASVTPFDSDGQIDYPSFARLLAYFDAAGCAGVVVAGTNGEGPSLSAVEKRDLVRNAVKFAGRLPVVAGIATASLSEAQWLAQQAQKAGATALLVMPPSYFKVPEIDPLVKWFEALMESSDLPVLAYNFPKMTGITLAPEFFSKLARHECFAGLKDSSGEVDNLASYRAAVRSHHTLWVGNELLLPAALSAGWAGSISGAANSVPQWLSQIAREFGAPETLESARTKFELLTPILQYIRTHPQPALHKQILTAFQILERPDVRLPLTPPDDDSRDELLEMIRATLGITPELLGLSRQSVQ